MTTDEDELLRQARAALSPAQWTAIFDELRFRIDIEIDEREETSSMVKLMAEQIVDDVEAGR